MIYEVIQICNLEISSSNHGRNGRAHLGRVLTVFFKSVLIAFRKEKALRAMFLMLVIPKRDICYWFLNLMV